MKEKLYKVIAEKGDTLGFSIALYNNELDPERTKLAKRVVKRFIEDFAKFCEEQDLHMTAGMQDTNAGASTYLSVSKGNDALMVLAVPHDIIEIVET